MMLGVTANNNYNDLTSDTGLVQSLQVNYMNCYKNEQNKINVTICTNNILYITNRHTIAPYTLQLFNFKKKL